MHEVSVNGDYIIDTGQVQPWSSFRRCMVVVVERGRGFALTFFVPDR